MAVTNVTGPSEDVREVVGEGKGDVGERFADMLIFNSHSHMKHVKKNY